jgi:CheY-like chemotaxis protein
MNQELTILVVDDDPDIRLSTARVLRRAGYRVEAAETGEQCLQMVSEKSPDLVLLDVILPDIDGYEVCRRIKGESDRPGTYVILASGKKTASDDQSEGLELGADGYIARPIPNRELLARTQAMARIIRAERERDRAIEELNAAMANIKTLKGLLPICASCKKIRDDQGYWNQVESYISTHSEVQFSHSVCPECAKKLYPEYYEDMFPEGDRGENKIEKL